MKRMMDCSLGRAALLAGIYLGTVIATTPRVFPQDKFLVSIENPFVQKAPLSSLAPVTGVFVETFDRASFNAITSPQTGTGFPAAPAAPSKVPFDFLGDSNIGTYTLSGNSFIRKADGTGGAFQPPPPTNEANFLKIGGNSSGAIVDLNVPPNFTAPSDTPGATFGQPTAFTTTTLIFKNPQRYFGMWWSAGSPDNTLTFKSGNTVLQTFHTVDITNFIQNESHLLTEQGIDPQDYLGNPNLPRTGNRGTSATAQATLPNGTVVGRSGGGNNQTNQIYVFINFFAGKNVAFNEVDLSGTFASGFETDNNTIATSFDDISGIQVNPDAPVIPGPGEGEDVGNGGVITPPGNPDVGGDLDIDQGGQVDTSGPTTVEPGGEITGDGMIKTPELINNGTVRPMGEEGTNTPGDLTLKGNFTQTGKGTLDIGIAGIQCPQSSRLVITGTAALNGTLDITSIAGFHAQPDTHYTIVIAGQGVSGAFVNVLDPVNTTGLTLAKITAPNGVVIAFLPPDPPVPVVLNLRSSVPVPLNSPCDVDQVLISAITPNADQLAAPFDIWFSLAQQQRFNLENHFDDIMATPTPTALPYTPPEKTGFAKEGKGVVAAPPPPVPERRWNVWATGFGDWVDINAEGQSKGYNYTIGGATFGVDYRPFDHFVIGLMGGYAHTWTDLKPGSVDLNTGWGGLYAGYSSHGFYVLGSAFGGGSSLDNSRADIVGGRANSSSNTQQWSTFVTVGYDFHCGQLTIGPLFAAQYSYIDLNSFEEHGSIADLSVNERSSESWRTDLGLRAYYNLQVGKIGVRPFVRAAWNHEYKENQNPLSVNLVGIQGPAVTVFGTPLGHDSCIVNAGVSVQITPTVSAYLGYDGQLGRSNFDYNGLSGGFNISF